MNLLESLGCAEIVLKYVMPPLALWPLTPLLQSGLLQSVPKFVGPVQNLAAIIQNMSMSVNHVQTSVGSAKKRAAALPAQAGKTFS